MLVCRSAWGPTRKPAEISFPFFEKEAGFEPGKPVLLEKPAKKSLRRGACRSWPGACVLQIDEVFKD